MNLNQDRPNEQNSLLKRGQVMSTTGALPSNPAIFPVKIAALLAALTVTTGAMIGLITSFEVVHWTPAQTTLVGTEVAAFWAFAGALAAHLWPDTSKQPAAVAGTVTSLVAATLSLGIGFSWWRLTEAQNASLISLVTAIVAVVTALVVRATVTAGTTGPRR